MGAGIWKCDALIQLYQNDNQIVNPGRRILECESACMVVPATLKRNKPISMKVLFRENVKILTWKSVVQAIL